MYYHKITTLDPVMLPSYSVRRFMFAMLTFCFLIWTDENVEKVCCETCLLLSDTLPAIEINLKVYTNDPDKLFDLTMD